MAHYPLIMELPYPHSLIEWVGRLQFLPHLIFLDSASEDRKLGRYSYMAADPFKVLRGGERGFWEDEIFHPGPIMSFLKERLAEYVMAGLPDLPPLQGGLMGFLSYEWGQEFEKLPKPIEMPQWPSLYLGFYDVVVAIDHLEKKAHLFSSGFPKKGDQRLERAEARLKYFSDLLLHSSPPLRDRDLPPIHLKAEWSDTTYMDRVKDTIEYIKSGDIYQANITQCFSASLPSSYNYLELYCRLREANPAPFAAYLAVGDIQLLSCSPERFIQVQDKKIEARPIKGTRPRYKNSIDDKEAALSLLQSEKDRAENLMIVDLLRNDLSKVAVLGTVKVPALWKLESYKSVHHLVSVIEAELNPDKNTLDLLQASFPGGSITGAPKIRAMEIIHELENRERGPYCGSIIWLGFNGNMDSNIVIRTLMAKDGKISLQAGCGIVADSDPEDEYKESLDKARVIMKILAHDLV